MKNTKPCYQLNNKNKDNTPCTLSRRKFIKMTSASLAVLSFPGLCTTGVKAKNNANAPKIVWVLLRGALDSLHTVVPTFDLQYNVLRYFLAGGAVYGGRISGKWPGLAEAELFEQRDLMPTTNSFSWIANMLAQQWDFSNQELLQVFPHVKAYDEKLIFS